jgi:transcriptional antiterminator NusG
MPLCSYARVTDAAKLSHFNPIRPLPAAAPAPPCGRAATGVPSTSVPQWFALRLRSNREFQVRAALEGYSIETFLPTWSESVRWTDRTKITERPLFPGYLFVRAAPGRDFYVCCATRGVIQMLPSSHKPTPIDESELEAVAMVVASKQRATPCEFTAGELVTIDSGPLAGVSGVVTRTKGALRVVVSLELLRRSIAVELDADTLIKKVAA